MPKKMMSIPEYARHRGCSAPAVRKAIATGRITLQAGKIDPVQADADWLANTRPQARRTTSRRREVPSAPADSTPVDYHGARARRETAEAKLAELKVAEAEGQVVRVAAVETWWIGSVRNCRQRLLSIPSRLAATVIGVKTAAEAHALIEAAVYEALEELSRDDAPPALQP